LILGRCDGDTVFRRAEVVERTRAARAAQDDRARQLLERVEGVRRGQAVASW
jgi:hypothetical protein